MPPGDDPPRGPRSPTVEGLAARNTALEGEVSRLRAELAALHEELQQLRRFRDTVWQQAVGELEQWAEREGMALQATRTHGTPRSGEVLTALAAEGLPLVELTPEPGARRPTSPDVPVERRASQRYPVDYPVRFAVAGGGQTTTGTLVELSETGLRIRAEDPVEPGTRVACGLYVEREGARELVLAKGEVVRSFGADEGGPGFAIRIEQITVAPQHLIEWLAAPLVIEPTGQRRRDTSTIKVRFRPTDVDPADEHPADDQDDDYQR